MQIKNRVPEAYIIDLPFSNSTKILELPKIQLSCLTHTIITIHDISPNLLTYDRIETNFEFARYSQHLKI